MYTQEDIDFAKQVLRDSGYAIDYCWQIEDVDDEMTIQGIPSDLLDDDEKMELLVSCVNNTSDIPDRIQEKVQQLLK